jgi:hypothetical protein
MLGAFFRYVQVFAHALAPISRPVSSQQKNQKLRGYFHAKVKSKPIFNAQIGKLIAHTRSADLAPVVLMESSGSPSDVRALARADPIKNEDHDTTG